MINQVIWSKKYNKWIQIKDIHPKHPNLSKFGDKWWYDFKKDKLIHIDIVDEYIKNTIGKQKEIRKGFFLTKKMKEKIEESLSNKAMIERSRLKLMESDKK